MGLVGLIAIAVNGVIGSGIFLLPATVAGLMGAASPAAYLVAAALTALVVACFAEAGSRLDATGGPYVYARVAFGPFVGFQVGWMFFLSRLAAAAAISNTFVAYLGYFWPAATAGFARAASLSLAVAVLTAVNLAGVRYGSRVVNVFTIAKLLPLLLFVGAGLFYADLTRSHLFAVPETAALRQAGLLLIFAFGGFENANVPSEETKSPRRDLPFALLTSIALTTVLYVLIQVVALGTLPTLATDKTPLASAGRIFLGPVGGGLITLGAVVSTAGSLSALILVGPRILYAFGVAGQLPTALASIHPRWSTPHVAVLVFAALALSSALLGSFADLAAVSALARLLFSAATCLAVPVLRRKMPGTDGFVVPGGVAVPALATALSLWLLSGVTRTQATAGAVAIGAGLVSYAITTGFRQTAP